MKTPLPSARGFSLVEVVLALGISAFALITIMALLPAGLGASKDSIAQTEAMNLATGVVADLRQTPTAAAIANSASQTTPLSSLSPRYKIDVTKASNTVYLDANGNYSTAITPSSHYKVLVSLTQPTSTPGLHTSTYGNVQFIWPPEAPANASSISVFVALDRN